MLLALHCKRCHAPVLLASLGTDTGIIEAARIKLGSSQVLCVLSAHEVQSMHAAPTWHCGWLLFSNVTAASCCTKACLTVSVRTALACSAGPTPRSSCRRKKWTPQLTGWKHCAAVHRVTAPQPSSCRQKRSRQGASSGLRGKAAMQQGRMAYTHQLPVELAVSALLLRAVCHKQVPVQSAGTKGCLGNLPACVQIGGQ